VIFEAEIDRLHRAAAAVVRAGGIGVNDLRGHLPLFTPCAVEVVHQLAVESGWSG
jgi:hypothetical protein